MGSSRIAFLKRLLNKPHFEQSFGYDGDVQQSDPRGPSTLVHGPLTVQTDFNDAMVSQAHPAMFQLEFSPQYNQTMVGSSMYSRVST
jgi:hypothetical protein